ncbi:hypothetical protein Ocin01_16869 [Orchesella cincta]|uniref:Uncharacterized protein n=1 Tax=Orchesella cincta TaxID=48709 RepID=A0A1D2MA42_ORCCI|nr:hypothetical protein Ocin01_16869 [Orchesella cincta]
MGNVPSHPVVVGNSEGLSDSDPLPPGVSEGIAVEREVELGDNPTDDEEDEIEKEEVVVYLRNENPADPGEQSRLQERNEELTELLRFAGIRIVQLEFQRRQGENDLRQVELQWRQAELERDQTELRLLETRHQLNQVKIARIKDQINEIKANNRILWGFLAGLILGGAYMTLIMQIRK